MRPSVRCLSVFAAICLLLPALWCRGVDAQEKPADAEKYDKIVDNFIDYDIGVLRGQRGRTANKLFQALREDEALPSLVRGVNRAARIRASCPIAAVSGKLQSMIRSTQDQHMLERVVEELDSSGPNVRYGSYVENLRRQANGRVRELQGLGPSAIHVLRGGTPDQLRRSRIPVDKWSYQDLEKAVAEDAGEKLMPALDELQRRKGSQYTDLLADAVTKAEGETKDVAQGLLSQRLSRMTDKTLEAKLRDPRSEVRIGAIRAIGYKALPMYGDLARALRDRDLTVAQEAHAVLVKLSGEDFGLPPIEKTFERHEAIKRWQRWAAGQGR